jgi:hypothetical protein
MTEEVLESETLCCSAAAKLSEISGVWCVRVCVCVSQTLETYHEQE